MVGRKGEDKGLSNILIPTTLPCLTQGDLNPCSQWYCSSPLDLRTEGRERKESVEKGDPLLVRWTDGLSGGGVGSGGVRTDTGVGTHPGSRGVPLHSPTFGVSTSTWGRKVFGPYPRFHLLWLSLFCPVVGVVSLLPHKRGFPGDSPCATSVPTTSGSGSAPVGPNVTTQSLDDLPTGTGARG